MNNISENYYIRFNSFLNQAQLIFLIFAAGFNFTIYSQTYNFKSISLRDGLSESAVKCIVQAKTGHILLGADAGVNIYDGVNFKYLNKNDGLPSSLIYTLNTDQDDNLLIGTDAGFVKKTKSKTYLYTRTEGLPANQIYSVELANDNSILIGTPQGLCELNNGEIRQPSKFEELRNETIYDILRDSKNNLWFATGSGIYCFSTGLEKITFETINSNSRFYTITEDRFGNIWTGNSEYLVKLKDKKLSKQWPVSAINSSIITNLLEDSFGNIWIGTYNGLMKYNGTKFQKYSQSNLFTDEYIYSLFEDEEKHLWIGTDQGVKLFTGEEFVLYENSDGIKSNIWSINQDFDGNIIAASDGTGIRKKSGVSFIDSGIPGVSGTTFWKVVNKNGKMYFGESTGLGIYDGKKYYKYDSKNGYDGGNIYEIFVDSKEIVWIGTAENGIYKFDGKTFVNYNESDGLIFNTVYKIIEDSKGNIWIGTEKGLSKFDGKMFLKFKYFDEFKNYTIMTMANADAGSIWLGTYEKGLIRFYIDKENKPYENISVKNGLNDNACMFIRKDISGIMYVGTNGGLNKFYEKTYLEEGTIKLISYNYDDGLPGIECNHESAYIDENSNLWYGTVRGIICYNPFEDYSTGHIPRTFITNLKVFFEDINLQKFGTKDSTSNSLPSNLVLPYNYNHLTFDFIGINLSNPSGVKYKHKLEGMDEEYFPASSRSSVTYSNLEPGKYIFKVLAADNRGNWNDNPAEYSFEIDRPYYMSPAFFIFIFLFTGGVIFGGYKYKIEKVDRKNQELIALIKEKDLFESKLLESEKDYRGLFENAHDPIIISNPEDLTIKDANKSALELYQFEYEEFIGKSLGIISTNIVGTKKYIRKVLLNKSLNNFEVKHKNKKGEIVELEVNASLINYKGENAILAIHRDITSRKKLEFNLNKAKTDAEKSEKLKSEFLAQMSHEIRTPVNTILSFISLLKDDLSDKIEDDLKESFGMIENGGKRLIRTVDSLLNMSQIQSGNYYLKFEKLNLFNDILIKIFEDFKSIAASKYIEFNLTQKTKKCIIEADSYSLNQLLINLIDNAIKYTDKGFVEIILYRDERAKLCVDVKDTGIGISEEYQDKLFEPFSQEDSGYTRSYEGNGLGLALVKHYCEMNRASIHIKSKKGEGSIFTVTFHSI